MPTIGVTGHRFVAGVERIAAGIEASLDRIDRAFPGAVRTVLSCLAEGADRLVAQRMLARPGSRLIVPLPLPRDEYMKDFHSAKSKRAFLDLLARADEVIELPPQPSRADAYRAAGLYVLDHSDVLIAVWDGEDVQGQGGTAEIVARARARKLPIAWVHAGNRRLATTEPTSLGDEQGTVTFENF